MLSIPLAVQDLVEAGRFSIRWMVRFDLESGPAGIWNDTYAITFEDVPYGPLAGNMDFSEIPGSAELASDKLSIIVSNLASAVTTIIASEIWHQRPATLYLAIMDDAGLVAHVIPRFSGFLDEVEISDAANETATLTLTIESNNRELNRTTGRARSDSDQRRISATDGFFKHAASAAADVNITWGRRGPQQPKQTKQKKSGLARFLSKIF